MIEIKIKDKTLYVKSPYNADLVSFMRSRPKRYWNSGNREWELPDADIELLLKQIEGQEYQITNLDTDAKQDSSASIPDWYEFKTKPYSYQVDGVAYGLSHDKFLLADTQGLGKTKQMLDLSCILKRTDNVKHVLIIACVNGLKFNWQREIEIHTDENSFILGTRINKKGKEIIGSNEERLKDIEAIGTGAPIDDCYYIITNVETLRYSKVVQVPLKTKRNGEQRYKKQTIFPIVEALQKQIADGNIGMIIADEVHRCLSGDTLVLTDATPRFVPISQIVKDGGHKYKIATVNETDGSISYVFPSNYFKNPKQYEMLKLHIQLETSDIKTVVCTKNHKFLTFDGEYVEAQYLKKDDVLFFEQRVLRIETIVFNDYVYDLEIPETHNYILDGGIVVHNCKDSNSLQGRALLALNAPHLVALTGTPIMNNPIDIYTALHWLGVEKHSLYSFKQHYCVMGGFGQHQIVGYRNLPDIQAMLDRCMLRRLKEDVLDLPEKIYINDYVEMSKEQAKIYEEVRANIVENIDKIRLSPNPLTMLIRLRQVTGNPALLSSAVKSNPKFDRMLEIVEDVVADGKKCLIFSNWTDVINPAYELLKSKGFRPALYTGENKDDRENEKDRFMTDKSCKVLLGTIGAMGTGLTLTAATTVIFLDEPWNRALKDQCEDRVHRIGTTESPNIITLICKGTIDEKINNIVYRKGKISDIVVDREEDIMKNPKLLNYLLSIS